MSKAVLDDTEMQSETDNDAEQHRRARGDYIEGEVAEEATTETAAEAGEAGDELDAESLRAVADDEDRMVPRSRLREIEREAKTEREARLRAEGERDALKAVKTTGSVDDAAAASRAAAVDVARLEEEVEEARQAGETKKALELQRQINKELQRQASEDALRRMQLEQDTRELARAAAAVVRDYPLLDSNNPDKDERAIRNVVRMRNSLIRDEGMTPAAALEEAAKEICDPIVKAAKATKDDEEGETEESPRKRVDPAEERRRQAIARGAETTNRQPPRPTGGVGNRANAGKLDGVDVAKLSDEEFAKLPKSEKARLRGDVVE